MSDHQTSTTELTSQYIAQVTSDLERNTKEQDRIATDITALQEQLSALQHDHTVLVNMQQALGGTPSAAAAAVAPVPSQASAPEKRTRAPKQTKQVQQAKAVQETKPKKTAPAATAKKTVAKKTEAKKTDAKKTAVKKPAAGKPAATATGTAAQPSLVDLIRTHLEEQKEPRSAAEITTALTAAHPDRTIKTTVVRTTLENLVARSSAHRNKQGTSVFYTATTAPAAAAEPETAAATA
ncbi:chemotaxis protein histidine kinase CheA [Streptomyces sp. V3I8]|uniref:hypothetical protein n=1 Tax=Streptomyces sp. V3I8 TaxID=3042279 RepID=UPI0027840071|nr:hypothetical protein [Streptomyces sp. V3I8]MDQ1041009.1 chemotaxis protein histidine kinase CheA [Streptomyces sp. V3I8]